MKLVNKNGTELKKGDVIKDFRGDKAIFVHGIPPDHSASTGRILFNGMQFDDWWATT